MKSFAAFVALTLAAGAVSAATTCGALFRADAGIGFDYDGRINPAVRKQIESFIYDISKSEGRFSKDASLKVSSASVAEVSAKAATWGFSTRANGVMENRLLAQTNSESTPRSLVQYKMTYEDGTVTYSEVFENQIVMDHFFVKAWIFAGPKYVTHGLPTEAWPTLLKLATKAPGHGQLQQIEKLVSSEIPILSVEQNQNTDVLAILDPNEGPMARTEQRDLRHVSGAKYVLSFVLPNGVTISKSLPQ